jgi:phosphoserine phosphatase RsbU/P
MNLNRNTLAFKLLAYALPPILIVLLLVLGIYYFFSKNILVQNVAKQGDYITAAMVSRIQNMSGNVEKAVDGRALLLAQESYSQYEVKLLTHDLVDLNKMLFGSTMAMNPAGDLGAFSPYYYRSGDSLAYLDLVDSYPYWEQNWYLKALEQQKGIWTEPYVDEGGGNILMTTYSSPAYSRNGDLVAVVTGDVGLEWLKTQLAAVTDYEGGFSFIVSSLGNIISHPDTELILSEDIHTIAKKEGDPVLLDALDDILSGKEGFIEVKNSQRYPDYFLYYRGIPAVNWSMCVFIPEKAFYADLYQMNYLLLAIVFIGLIIIVFVIQVVARRLTRPLYKLSLAASATGSGDFKANLPEKIFSSELIQLRDSVSKMQQDLQQHILDIQTATADKEKYESEINVARDIQMSIVPHIFPPFPSRKDMDVFAKIKLADTMGSDFYDFFFIGDHKLCFALGEVSGKGVPASLFMAVTRTLLRSVAQESHRPDEILWHINKDLCSGNSTGMTVAFFVGILNLKSGEILYVNAGGQYPAILRSGGKYEEIDTLSAREPGTDENTIYIADTFSMEPGDHLLLCSDGIIEAANEAGAKFGETSLAKTLTGFQGQKPAELTNRLFTDLENFRGGALQTDDYTLLALSYYGAETGGKQ